MVLQLKELAADSYSARKAFVPTPRLSSTSNLIFFVKSVVRVVFENTII